MKNSTKKRLAVAFTGPSNSGKTTLIEQLSKILHKDGYEVAIVKHDPKDKAKFDTEGKDSYKFTQTKASVAVVSPTRTTMFKNKTSTIDEIVDMFGEFDFLLVEGLKTLPLPRICVQRGELNFDYFELSDCIALDDSVDTTQLPQDMDIVDLNNYNQIINWIKQNGKEV